MNSRLRPWIPLLIAVAPALGYGLAYVHEQGYCAAYHIPFDLIHLDLTTILIAIAKSLGGVALLVWFVFLAMSIPLYISAIKKTIIYFLISLFFLFLFGWQFLMTVEFVQLLMTLVVLFVFISTFPRILSWLIRKFQSKFRRKRQRLDIPIVRLLNNKYVQYGCIVIVVIFYIFGCGYLAGRSEAVNKEIFLVASSNPELVVLKVYGDNIICGKLVQESDKIGLGPTITLLRLDDISDLTLTPIRVKLSFTQYPK